MADGTEIVRRYNAGKAARVNCDSRVDRLAPYICPSRYGVQNKLTEGQLLMSDVYDSQGIFAADIAAKFIGGELHNPATKWLNYRERRAWLNDDDDVRQWLDESRDRQLQDLAASNFYAEAYEMDIDWVGFGIGSNLIEENPVLSSKPQSGYRGTRFTVDKIGRYVVFENGWHQVDSLYREITLTARGAAERFGKDSLSDSIKGALNRGDETTRFTFIHGIYPRSGDEQKGYGAKRFPWASCYVEAATKQLLKESGYEEYPAINPRWSRVPGEIYGRGLGEIALQDMQTLNTAIRMSLEDWALKIRPVTFTGHDTVIGTLRLKPGSFVTVRSGGRALADLFYQHQTGSHPEVSQIQAERLVQAIRQAFFVDQILQMLQVDKTQMTAYEFGKKMELLFKLLGPIYGRWMSEYGKPLVERHFNLLYRHGVFSPPPDILLENGGDIQVEFENALARAQRMEEVNAMDRLMQRIVPIGEAQIKLGGKSYAEVLDLLPVDQWVRKAAEIEGVPASLINSSKTVAVLRNSRAEYEQQKAAGEQAMMVAQGMGKAAPMVKAMQGSQAA